ncbi:MAG: GNAT family N-acetyltransferase [Bacillota bacterium]|jgi:hypothetical protein
MYKITLAQREDMDFLIKMARQEGWNPGLTDGECLFAADPEGFFIGWLDNEPIACISAVKYDGFGFVGLYIVREGYRGRGYGLEIWCRAMEHLSGDDLNIGLDGVPQRQADYMKSGFRFYHRNLRYGGRITGFIPNCRGIEEASPVDFEKIKTYYRRYFPAQREDFLQKWLFAAGHRALIRKQAGEITGLGVIRTCVDGYKIGPLFAEDQETAQGIFEALAAPLQGENIYIDLLEGNALADWLRQKHGLGRIFENARMYTKEQPGLKWDNVYGITTFELG